MLKQKQKIIHLLGELLQYSLQGEPQKVVITIEDLSDRVQITVEDCGAERSDEECWRAQCLLNAPYRNEMRDYYSGLAGEETVGPCDLRVVRMMVDGGTIESGDSGTRLSVWWAPE